MDGDKLHAIVIPCFRRSVSDWLEQQRDFPLAAIKVIARDCFEALRYLHCKDYYFADLKPSNIMLQGTKSVQATLVDYGAVVRIGSPIREYTKQYCLDSDKITATEYIDWICLGRPLAETAGISSHLYNSADLASAIAESSKSEYFKTLVLACLQDPSELRIQSALEQAV